MPTGWKEKSNGMDSEIDAKTFWKALGCRAIGVAIVTARGTDGWLPGLVGHASFGQRAHDDGLDRHTTSALGAVRQGNHFTINYLAKGQRRPHQGVRRRRGAQGRGPLQARHLGRAQDGAPALVDAVGVIDCRLEEMIERHGAVIALGRVVAYTALAKEPMISFRGGYL
jgi:flavin reductase (DIM6/NTAB) family NADH-FMN oxidoreductase RutF